MVYAVDPPVLDPCHTAPLPPPFDQEPPLIRARVNMRATGIVARRLAGGAPSGSLYAITTPDQAIDVEPQLAISPEGHVYCVWVRDANPLHQNLTDSNAGRNLFYSRFSAGSWTTPQPIIANVSSMPGILEPSLGLIGGGYGFLAFTALPENASPCDAGLGNLRLLYVVRVSNAGGNPVWDAPVLIQKKCGTPVFVHWPLVIHEELQAPIPELGAPSPVLLVANEVGPSGESPSLANIVSLSADPVTGVLGFPQTLTVDGALHEDVTAVVAGGELVTVSQTFPIPGTGAGGGGGADDGAQVLGGDIRVASLPLVADPSISSCRLSDPYAGPGSSLEVTLGIANHGFAWTPATASGQSLLGLKLLYEDEGIRSVVAEAVVPRLAPGTEAGLEFAITIPRRPVRLIAEVDAVPGERNPADNVRDCALGAPVPRDVRCELLDGEGSRAVRVRWLPGGLYDAALIYRDGSLLAELPGSATSYLDSGLTLNSADGAAVIREYGVRGVIQESRSARAACEVEIPGVATGSRFRRGDADDNSRLELTDAVRILNHLFLGGRAPPCFDAADADDSGRLNITDPIRILGHLFLGEAPPPAPGPSACGFDSTPDELPECPGGETCL